MTTQAPGQTDSVNTVVSRLRAEHAANEDKALKALLLHECGVLEENQGEEPVAARDYLAAFNLDPHFREPLEALVRILTRRKSIKNLGKLLDALTRASATPEERSRAFADRASYLQDYEQNLTAAKESLEEAASANPEDPLPWLELELLAAKEGDNAARMRAVEARAELATDPTWKALLYIDLAELASKSGDAARAYDLLDTAAALEGRARFRTRLLLEGVAAKEENLEVLAQALEGQADLIAEAMEDGAHGDAIGVPRYMRNAEHAADAWFRAAELRRRSGDADGARGLINRAAERLPESTVIARARLVALEVAGDAEGAAVVAKKELERGATGPGAASLWLRVAEAAALANDRAEALTALRGAITADPGCIPAAALELDLLGDAQEPAALAEALESIAEGFKTDDAKGRAFLLAAYVWACSAGDTAAAKTALSQAAQCGVAPGIVARLARSLAAIRGDAVWYEESTKRLLAAGAEASEHASLWFELGRSRLLRGDDPGAAEAFAKLATTGAEDGGAGPSAWLGRMLGAYAIGLGDGPEAGERGEGEAEPSKARARSPEAIEELAKVEPDPAMARGLSVVAALRAARGGDRERARSSLRSLHQASAGDEVVAVYLADLERRAGDAPAAAAALASCAAATEDADLSAALHIEAALLLWRAGDRAAALAELEAAKVGAPKAAATVLNWALPGADPDTREGRRRSLEAAIEAGADPIIAALERFGLEVAGTNEDALGDPEEATTALEIVEGGATDDIMVAASLARLVWSPALEQRSLAESALSHLEGAGREGIAIARAERFRMARTIEQDRAAAGEYAAAWAVAAPALYTSLEWLGAALAAEDRGAEIEARRVVAKQLDGDARSAMEASAAIVAMLDQPTELPDFVGGDRAPGQLTNLELALPGCDPRRRAAALHGIGAALGEDAQIDALALAAWSELASGDTQRALETFQAVVEARPDDIVSWEGVRAASEVLGDHVSMALASAQLGSLCHDDARGARFWESAGMILLEHTEAHDDAEIAFARSFERDPRRAVAFDKLFRRVRGRNEDDKLLEIIGQRLTVADDETEIAKLFWERARVLRKKGDRDGALAALENVTMLEADHVGALALAGEIHITKSNFAQAAPLLARLATIREAPTQQRLMSGVAAVDLFEKKLGEPEKALEVLVGLHKAGLSTGPVRERLAGAAARTGAWDEATKILDQLMNERDKQEGRIDAARLCMAIWRDKLGEPLRAEAAVAKLLEESPDDGEAIDLVLTTSYDAAFRTRLLGRAKSTLVQALAQNPTDADRVALLAKIAGASQDAALRQATLGTLVALGRSDAGISEELSRIDARVAAKPQTQIDVAEIADPQDGGPIAELFKRMAETIGAALGPSLASAGVTKKDKVEARGGHPLRLAVAEWMGALGFEGDFDLYVGGKDPRAVHGIAGEQPALVLGSGVTTPLDATSRSAIAREVFALKRGITAVRTRDENTIASIVVAACIESGLPAPNPGYAVFGEVSRGIHKEISRKVKKDILEPCQRIMAGGTDARAWCEAARRSIDRMAVIAAGDVSIVLADALGAPRGELAQLVPESERARRLLGFVLSPSYLELRRKLGMGVR